jgi:hypothetical protein
MTSRFRQLSLGVSLMLIGAALAALVGRALFASAAPSFTTLAQTVPAATRGRAPTGRLPQQQTLALTFTLQPQNKAALERFVAAASTPHSSHYHQFITPATFARAFGPSPAAVQRVLAFARQAGLRVTRIQSGGLYITVAGSVHQIEAAFHVHLNTYRDSHGRAFFANDSNITLPAGVAPAVLSVVGLDDAVTRQRMSTSPHRASGHIVARPRTPAGCPQATGQNTLVPSQLATAYGFPTNLNGAGQSMALVEFDGYLPSDISAYAACFAPNVTTSSVVTSRLVDLSSPLPPGAGAIEDELDIEVALGMAPSLSKIHVYEAPNTNQGLIDMLAAIAGDDADGTVSDSWGSCESDTGFSLAASEEMAFLQMAAQGQGVYVAAGDSGAYDCLNDLGTDPYFHGQIVNADDPASDPYVTAVGGTTLTVNASTSSYMGETVWNNTNLPNPVLGASGGGLSEFWASPAWQAQAKATSATGGISDPSGARALPDVTADADPQTGYAEYCTAGDYCASAPSSWFDIGGTSAAAPLWASLALLANQSAGGRVGLITPALYSLYGADTAGKTAAGISLGGTTYYDYATQYNGSAVTGGTIVFNDITSGNNSFPGSQGFVAGYSAQAGYSAVAGLGSMQAQAVVNFLKSNLRFTAPRLYLAAQGNDKRYWLSGYYLNNGDNIIMPDSPQASNWLPLGSQTFQGAPAIVDNGIATAGLSGSTAQVWVAGIDSGGTAHIGAWNPSTMTFGGWQTVPGTTLCKGSPATTYAKSTLFVSCETTTGGLAIDAYVPQSGFWGGWAIIGGGLTASPTMATNGTQILLYAQTNQNDWFNTYAVGTGALGVWRHMATTCEATPAVAYTGTTGQFALSCIANDTSSMWANTFDLTTGTLSGWVNLGAPIGTGFHDATAISVDLLDNPGVLLYTGEGKNNAAYVQLVTDNFFYAYVTGWQIASLPGIFATNAATDYFGV